MATKLPNINEATFEDLQKIAFIGPARAQTIVDYLDTHEGKLENVMQVGHANGIGDSIATQMAEMFMAEPLSKPRAKSDKKAEPAHTVQTSHE